MPRKPDTVCAGGCGRLLWSGTGSRPAGERICRPCRRRRREQAAAEPVRFPLEPVELEPVLLERLTDG